MNVVNEKLYVVVFGIINKKLTLILQIWHLKQIKIQSSDRNNMGQKMGN
jgi:hypothetical protein